MNDKPDAPVGPTARVFAVLNAVAERGRPVAVSEIAETVGLAVPTAHRIVAGLEQQGLLQRGVDPKRLVVGPALISLGFKVAIATFHDAHRHAILQRLAEGLGEQVELGVIRGNVVVYLDSVRSSHPAGLQIEPGLRAPLHCTSTGKLHLGFLPPGARERLVRSLPLTRHTPRTIVEPGDLLETARKARKDGFAATVEEFVAGVVGCAVPVLDGSGNMVAGLGVTAPAARLDTAGIEKHLTTLRLAAECLAASFQEDAAGPHPTDEKAP